MQCLLAWIYGRVEKKAAPKWAPHEGKINRKLSTQRFLVGAILYILGVAFSLSRIFMQINSKWPPSCAVRAVGKCIVGECLDA